MIFFLYLQTTFSLFVLKQSRYRIRNVHTLTYATNTPHSLMLVDMMSEQKDECFVMSICALTAWYQSERTRVSIWCRSFCKSLPSEEKRRFQISWPRRGHVARLRDEGRRFARRLSSCSCADASGHRASDRWRRFSVWRARRSDATPRARILMLGWTGRGFDVTWRRLLRRMGGWGHTC